MTARIAWALLCLFVFSVPWEKSVAIPGLGTVTRILGALALAFALAAAVRRRNSLRPPNLALALAAGFVLWSAATWFWSYDPAATLARTWTLLQLLAMAWVIWESVRTGGEQRQLLHAYVAGAGVASVATVIRYARGVETNWRRYAAPGFDPNDLGLTLALSIPIALYLAMGARRRSAWVYWPLTGLVCAAILLTASRMALLAGMLAFSFAALAWRQSGASQRLASGLLFAILPAGALWLAPAEARERMATLPAELTRGTLHNRTNIWKAGVKAFKQHPAIGAGSGAFPAAVRPWLGVPGRPGHQYVAHNTFLSVLVETGVLGWAMFFGLLATLGIFVWMLPAPERALWTAVLVVWATGVSTLTWEHRKPSWIVFALIMTAWVRAWRDHEEPVPCRT